MQAESSDASYVRSVCESSSSSLFPLVTRRFRCPRDFFLVFLSDFYEWYVLIVTKKT